MYLVWLCISELAVTGQSINTMTYTYIATCFDFRMNMLTITLSFMA